MIIIPPCLSTAQARVLGLFEERLRTFINTTFVLSTLRATGWENKMNCTEFAWCTPHGTYWEVTLASHQLVTV